jgi:Tfp pilus assembly protein PilV
MAMRRSRGYSLLEILVSLAVLLAGIVLIIYVFPQILRSTYNAEYLSKAALLAQLKVEEIRRDDSKDKAMQGAIAALTAPTQFMPFTQEPALSYAFSGETILYRDDNPVTPRSDSNVARVIIKYSDSFRKSHNLNAADKDVLYELRFGP